jgi:hypothetical protein
MTPTRLPARGATALVGAVFVAVVVGGCAARHYAQAACDQSRQSIFLLEAQAVPSATYVPCILPLPAGWGYSGSELRSGLVRFWLDSDRGGRHAVEVTLTRACDLSAARKVRLSRAPAGLSRYDEPVSLHPGSSVSYFRFAGGCVTYRLSFTRGGEPAIFHEADRFLGFTPRSLYVRSLRQDLGVTLCGAGAPPCPG